VQDRNGRLLTLLHWLHEERAAKPRPPAAIQRAQVSLLFHEFEALSRPRPPGRIERVKTLIAERLADRFSLDELAKAAGLSRYHFCRVFREEAGESPIAFQQRLRVERAVELIRTTELPFKEVARIVGLGSATYLSRLVRKYVRRSPTELRPKAGR
jgi:transcriptional regulator GlxA family with amidase domain